MFFFPLFDDNPTASKPLINWLLIGFMMAWYFGYQLVNPPEFIYAVGFIPARLFFGAELPASLDIFSPSVTLVTAMVSHGGFMHIAGNLWVAYLLGDNLEDKMGKLKFLFFVILCGIAGNLAHGFTDTSSEVPLVGFSGAVSGMILAYVMLFPRANFKCLFVFFVFFRTMNIPAIAIFALWAFGQISGVLSAPDGVAYWAHAGGAVAGAALIPFFKKPHVKFNAPKLTASGMSTAQKVSLRRGSVPSVKRKTDPWG